MASLGDTEQTRRIVEQAGEAAASIAIREFVSQHPHFAPPPPKVEIPHAVKVAGGVLTALMTAGVIALAFWVVSTLNQLQLTVGSIDTRMTYDTSGKRLDALEKVTSENSKRITEIERVKH